MSKMSQLHAELSEQAYELGFKSIEDAEQHGYILDYEGGKLVPTEEIMKQQHEAWLKERDETIKNLTDLGFDMVREDGVPPDWAKTIFKAVDFIKKGEM